MNTVFIQIPCPCVALKKCGRVLFKTVTSLLRSVRIKMPAVYSLYGNNVKIKEKEFEHCDLCVTEYFEHGNMLSAICSLQVRIACTALFWHVHSFLKSTTFWAVMLCSPLKVNQCFGISYSLHLQGEISCGINPHGQQLTSTCIQETTSWFHNHGNVTIRYHVWLHQFLLCRRNVINTVTIVCL
jgi:hypothetical protein